MKLGIAHRPHVGDMHVPAAPASLLVNPRAVLLYPLAIIERHLVLERLDNHRPRELPV